MSLEEKCRLLREQFNPFDGKVNFSTSAQQDHGFGNLIPQIDQIDLLVEELEKSYPAIAAKITGGWCKHQNAVIESDVANKERQIVYVGFCCRVEHLTNPTFVNAIFDIIAMYDITEVFGPDADKELEEFGIRQRFNKSLVLDCQSKSFSLDNDGALLFPLMKVLQVRRSESVKNIF